MESNCNTASVYDSIESCPGQRSLPGIRRRLFYINKADIAAFPTLPTPSAENITMAGLAAYTGDFTLQSDKYFQYIDLKDEASNVTFETVGEDGSKLVNNQANAIVAGMEDDVKGFVRQALNDDVIYVYQQRDGKFCIIGNEMFKCHTNGSGDTAAEATGAITTTLAINCYDECPVPTYKGKLMPSSTEYMDCADGKVKTVSQ